MLTGSCRVVALSALCFAVVRANPKFLDAPPANALYKNTSAPVDVRVKDLLSRMTIEEKVNQMALPFGAHYPEDYVQYNATGLGATYTFGSFDIRNQWQRWQVENSRLGIPTSFIGETLHSGYRQGTVFPMPCLQGATWDRDLVQAAASVIALEARTSGVDRGFSPVLHGCTDPRFGRCEEAFGEDPQLIAIMGVAAVTGLSGPGAAGAASTYIAEPTKKIATEAKHFAAYSYGGRDGSMPADISELTLYDVYLKPWYKYAQAGGRGIMAAHNTVNGMPCHGNKALLTTALREQFGFAGGLCASDAGDINHLVAYHVAANATHAGAIAVKAGMDQELDRNGAFRQLPEALSLGLASMEDVDRAVGNVLRQKFASGLFDGRDELLYVNETAQAAVVDMPTSRALARKIAEEGIVLLRNSPASGSGSTQLLPLQGLGKSLKKVAIIGPNADNAHSTMGGYTESGAAIVTVLGGAVAAANASGNAFTVEYERGGCLGGTPGCSCPAFKVGVDIPCGLNITDRIPIAAELASDADVTVLVLGDSSTLLAGDSKAHEETGTCGEHFDRDSLDLPGMQLPLLEAVLNVSSNVIVVLITGRTATFGGMTYNPLGRNAMFYETPAVLAAWRPGEEAGNAVWGIINGSVNPSGRSVHTWPRTVGQVHQYVPWYLPWATRATSQVYADMAPATPLVAFGQGLSYTNYSLFNFTFNTTSLTASDSFEVSMNVNSVGPAGKLVIQAYFSQDLASRVRYQQMLLGFTKVEVPANAKGMPATITLKARDFEMWDKTAQHYVVEPGNFSVYIGQSSIDPEMHHGRITVVDQMQT